MKKAVSLILCLLFCAPQAAAQQRNPPPPRPRSFFEQTMGITRPGTATEQRRERELTLLERAIERARARQPAPGQEQEPVPSSSSVTLSVDFNPTFCILNCPQPPVNVRPSLPAAPKRGVPAVQFEEGLTPDQLSGRAPLPPSKGLPKPGEYGGGAVSIKGDLNGPQFWSEADSAELNRGLEDIGRIAKGIGQISDSIGQGVEELNRINRPLPSASAAVAPSTRNTVDVTALAASHRQPDTRRVETANPSGRATVRSAPGRYMVGSVYEGDNFRIGDQFRVKAHDKSKGCWLLGDVVGSPHLRNVWIDCDDLSGKDRANRRATEVPDVGPESEADLGRSFASIVLPSTGCNHGDSKYLTDVKRDTAPDKLKLYGNYNPRTRELTDEVTSIVPGNVVKVRYLSDDHLAAAVHYVFKDALGNELSRWGFVSSEILALPLREDTTPCVKRTP